MIGIVLWSDPEDRKAVFWCEDQGDLAYFEGGAPTEGARAPFFAGDMVQFEVSAQKKMRLAHDAVLLQERVCKHLPDHLRATSEELPVQAQACADIILFTQTADEMPAVPIVRNG